MWKVILAIALILLLVIAAEAAIRAPSVEPPMLAPALAASSSPPEQWERERLAVLQSRVQSLTEDLTKMREHLVITSVERDEALREWSACEFRTSRRGK